MDPAWKEVVGAVSAAAEVLHDHQTMRIRMANQLQALTTPESKKTSGGYFGKGRPLTDPAVVAKAAMVEYLKVEEARLTKILVGVIRGKEGAVSVMHPLYPWIKATPGVSERSIGRLLGCIGNPAWHARDERPRTLGELNAYCGMNVIDGVAPRHTRGVQSDFKTKARTRLYVAAEAAMKHRCPNCRAAGKEREEAGWAPPPPTCTCPETHPYRAVYDAARAHYADAIHARDCRGRGSCGRGAGTPLNDAHKNARALRAVMKAILRDMWTEARRVDGLGD